MITVSGIVTPSRAVDRAWLDRRAEPIQTCLERAVGPGAPIGIWVEDPIDFAACVLAAMAVRAQAFVVQPDASPAQVEHLCAIEGARALLCDDARAGRLADRLRLSRQPTHPPGPGLALLETQPHESAPVEPDEGSVHFFTSGTDGRPKGVVRTRSSLALEDRTVGGHLGMGPGRAVLCAVPVTHGYGFTGGLSAPMSFGGTAIVAQPRLAASLAKLLIEHRPEIVIGVPAQYAAWSALRERYSGPLPRVWLCGGAPLPAAVRARFERAWGGLISEQYGMTECGAVTVDLEGAGTLGKPYPGVTVSIDGDGTAGAVGEVVAATPYGPKGYIGGPADGRPSPFTPTGVRTGDSGWLDADGRLHLVGRRAHQLNVRGKKVDPAEVERAFWALDGVRDVAVVGVDRADGDQWIAAFVVCADLSADDALEQATDHLESFKRPQRVIVLSALPRTATGTDFPALRAMVSRDLDA